MEDDVEVWWNAILELHARNDADIDQQIDLRDGLKKPYTSATKDDKL